MPLYTPSITLYCKHKANIYNTGMPTRWKMIQPISWHSTVNLKYNKQTIKNLIIIGAIRCKRGLVSNRWGQFEKKKKTTTMKKHDARTHEMGGRPQQNTRLHTCWIQSAGLRSFSRTRRKGKQKTKQKCMMNKRILSEVYGRGGFHLCTVQSALWIIWWNKLKTT